MKMNEPKHSLTNDQLSLDLDISKENLSNQTLPLDLESVQNCIEMAAILIEGGVKKFADYAVFLKSDQPEIWKRLKYDLHGIWSAAILTDRTALSVGRLEAYKIVTLIDKGEDVSKIEYVDFQHCESEQDSSIEDIHYEIILQKDVNKQLCNILCPKYLMNSLHSQRINMKKNVIEKIKSKYGFMINNDKTEAYAELLFLRAENHILRMELFRSGKDFVINNEIRKIKIKENEITQYFTSKYSEIEESDTDK